MNSLQVRITQLSNRIAKELENIDSSKELGSVLYDCRTLLNDMFRVSDKLSPRTLKSLPFRDEVEILTFGSKNSIEIVAILPGPDHWNYKLFYYEK